MSDGGELIALGVASSPLLQGIGDVLEMGVLTLDRDLVVTGCNRWLASAANIDPSDLIGRPLFERFDTLADGPAGEAFRRALDGATIVWSHQFHRYLLPLPPAAGHEAFDQMQQIARIVPIMRDGRVAGVLALIQDVTERVAREQALRRALLEAEAASQAKSDFLAAMSHELRTPLGAIIGFMDLLLGKMVGPVAPLQATYLGRVRSAAQHLISVIEEILTFSRIEAGKEPLHVDETDVVTLARDVEELLEPQALRKGIDLRIALPAPRVMIRTDPTKLRQILINLLGNAIKFTDTGSVTLAMTCDDERVVFRVHDTGPGITPADLARIFEAFTQVDQSLKRSKGGTGLGLPVSRRLSHLLGGELTVESIVAEGTTFTLWLPQNVASGSHRGLEAPGATMSANAGS